MSTIEETKAAVLGLIRSVFGEVTLEEGGADGESCYVTIFVAGKMCGWELVDVTATTRRGAWEKALVAARLRVSDAIASIEQEIADAEAEVARLRALGSRAIDAINSIDTKGETS